MIQTLLVDLQMDICAERVTSQENRADALSRGDCSTLEAKHFVPLLLPEDLDLLFVEEPPPVVVQLESCETML